MTATFGFRAISTLGGSNAPVQQTYRVSAAAGNSFAIGDAVAITATGRVKPLAAGSTTTFCGVIQSLERNSGGVPAPLTFNQPTRGPYLAPSQDGFAKVNINPYQVYEAVIDVSVSTGIIGNTVGVSVKVPVSASGRSGMSLRGASLGVVNDLPFKIIGIGPAEIVSGNYETDLPAGRTVQVIPNSIFTKVLSGI